MAVAYEGKGTTFTRAGLTLKPKSITFPGKTVEAIDVTTLSNTAAKTFVMSGLYESTDFVLTLEFDPSVYEGIVASGNLSTVVTFAGTTEKITFWADVMEVGQVEINFEEQPVFDVTFKVTNLNGSNVETVPAYAAS